MNKTKVFISAAALLVSSASSAAIISYNGYEYDDEGTTNIVTGGGLEWLRWDQTIGMSIDNAVPSNIEGGGWSLASNTQMADLFNAFNFGLTNFGSSFADMENSFQFVSTGVEAGVETGTDLTFVSMFGNTYGDSYADNGEGPLEASRALFGSDADGDSYYNLAEVYDDYRSLDSATDPGLARLNGDYYSSYSNFSLLGIALVREIGTSDSGDGSTTVPEPSVLALFGAGLLGLGFVRRRKQS